MEEQHKFALQFSFTGSGPDPLVSEVTAQTAVQIAPCSPALMVMGGDTYSEGRGFESQHCILDGHFLTYTCKNCNVCLKRQK